MQVIIKVVISGLLLGCLAKMPYGYFQFVKVATCIGFLTLAYFEFQKQRYMQVIVCIGLAVLLNPVFKFHFGRKKWNEIDLYIGVALLVWALSDFLFSYLKKETV